MKKIVSYLALATFALASHMSSVHAWDMFGMEMVHWHSEAIANSIFCNDSPVQDGKSDCAKGPIPENAAITSRSNETPVAKAWYAPSADFFIRPGGETFRNPATAAVSPPPRKTIGAQRGDAYANRIGSEIRKLD